MKKTIAIILFLFFMVGCKPIIKPDLDKATSDQQTASEVTAIIQQSMKIPSLVDISATDVDKILYFDDSQPPNTPAATYVSSEEIRKILRMFEGITLNRQLPDDELPEIAAGDFCGYEIHLKDGSNYTLWRVGRAIICEGKRYEYTGDFYKQLHIDEVAIYVPCSIGYPDNGRIGLVVRAFDEENTTVTDAPIIKECDGSRWTVVEPVIPGSGSRIPISDLLPYIDLEKNYPQVTTGDFKITYHVYLPSGEQKDITAQFTIFEE